MYFCGVELKRKIMTVVSTKEFNTHQPKYFEMAINERVYVQNGEYTFIVPKIRKQKIWISQDKSYSVFDFRIEIIECF